MLATGRERGVVYLGDSSPSLFTAAGDNDDDDDCDAADRDDDDGGENDGCIPEVGEVDEFAADRAQR